MTHESKSKQTKTYEVHVQRTITWATESATLRVEAANQMEAEDIAESLYKEGEITFEDFELQDCAVSYTAERLTDGARIARLMLTIRQISAATTGHNDGEILAEIQGLCRRAIELEQQGVKK